MSNKQQKKIRQLVRRERATLVKQAWDMFFDEMMKLPFKYRIKMAWFIVIKKKIR